jgi:threonyl-tRNA synthetase
MYWHGHWQDLCRGPHLQHTGQVPGDAFKLMSVAGAYWRGDSTAPCSSASTASPSRTATS